MTGKGPSNQKIIGTHRSRGRTALETVDELSNEISAQCTERVGQSRESVNLRQSSPFIVEKIEFNIDDPCEQSRVEEKKPKEEFELPSSFIKLKIPKKNKEPQPDKSGIEFDQETKFPSNSYRTPLKAEKHDSFLSPKESNTGKTGFFSMRKKLGSRPDQIEQNLGSNPGLPSSTSTGSRIKIVNNIFQNTFLQNYIKGECSNKRKISDLKNEYGASKGSIKKKGNYSMDILDKDTGRTMKGVPSVLSPPDSINRKLNFHLNGFNKVNLANDKKNTSKPRTSKQSFVTEESIMSIKGVDQEKKFKSMCKFHEKLGRLVNDVQGTEGEVDLKTAWRFVKDVVKGYAEASKKIKQLEAVLQSK